ncbi:MAG: CaiB/BaiF CoA transferase family protein [Lautropia sp.]
MSTPSEGIRTLSHIRVLDLSRILAGPWCAQNLADLGADVIKVERPGRGDDTRAWGPPWIADGAGGNSTDSTYYASANRGKKSITCDLSRPEGQALVRELAKTVDVVIENYKVGDLKRYGLDYAALSAINPGLVYLSITGYGQEGPSSHKPGYDFVFQGVGGMMSITGEADGKPGGGPQKAGVAIADLMTGQYSTIAILAALSHRSVTGKGQYIDMALLDCVVAMGSNQITSFLRSGRIPHRYGNAHASLVPYQSFETADQPIVIAVGNDAQWQRYCEVVERPDLATNERWKTSAGRITGRAELVPDLERTMLKRSAADWIERFEAADVPVGPINDYRQVFEDPQVVHRGLKVEMKRADGGTVGTVASPIRLKGTPVEYRRAPPLLGEHTDEVLGTLLGKTGAEIAALRAKGIV